MFFLHFRLKCGTGRSDRTVFADEDSLAASQCRSPCCFGAHPCPWWPQIATTQALSLCRRPFGAIVVQLLVMSLLEMFGGSAHLQGDSEMNAVNFLQTGVATFVCPGNNPFILERAQRLAWAFVRPPADRLPCTCTHAFPRTLRKSLSLVFRRPCISIIVHPM